MKSKFAGISGIAAVLLGAAVGYAADPDSDRYEPTHAEGAPPAFHPVKASDALGRQVRNPQNQIVGTIDELAVDLTAGRIAQVIVSSGGILGVGKTSWAIPPELFSYDSATDTIRVEADHDLLAGAPRFDLARWDTGSGSSHVEAIYRHYGRRPYFTAARSLDTARDETARDTADRRISGLGPLVKASDVVGQEIVNRLDEKLGKVEEIVVDPASGRIVYLVVESGGFLGIGGELSAVPPGAIRTTPDRDVLVLDVTRDSLEKGPRFRSEGWPDLTDPTYADRVSRAYGFGPYFTPRSDTERRAVRDREQTAPQRHE